MDDMNWFRLFLQSTRKACTWGLCKGKGYEGGRCNSCGFPICL